MVLLTPRHLLILLEDRLIIFPPIFRLSVVGSYLCAVWFVTARYNVLRITRPITISLRQTTESLSPPQYLDTLSPNLFLTIPSSQVNVLREALEKTYVKLYLTVQLDPRPVKYPGGRSDPAPASTLSPPSSQPDLILPGSRSTLSRAFNVRGWTRTTNKNSG